MKRGWLLLLVLSLGLNAGLLWRTLSDRPAGPPPFPRIDRPRDEGGADWERLAETRHARLADRIGLDPVRREKFLSIRRETLPALLSLRQEVRAARQALHGAFYEAPFDTQRIGAGLDRLAAAQARVDSLVTAGMLRELGMLEPDERETYLSAMRWEHDPGRGERRHGPRRGRGGPAD